MGGGGGGHLGRGSRARSTRKSYLEEDGRAELGLF